MWDWAVWGALIAGGLAGVAALGLLARRALEAWRGLDEIRHAVVRGLDDLASSGEAVADKVAAAGDTAELQESLGRLRHSLARLAVLRAAIAEAQDTFGRITVLLPRK
jgi:hypothetical protein